MQIDLVFPVLPPTLDGIGDHTARLAEELACTDSVRVLCAQSQTTPIPGVDIVTAFDNDTRSGIRSVRSALEARVPDWLVVQFNQFSYGKWGLNPFLPLTLYEIKKAHPDLKLAWLAHEDFVPATTWKFAIMSSWQRAQFWALGRLANRIFFTTDYWVDKYRSWFPDVPIQQLSVGSNIPRVDSDPSVERKHLDLPPDAFVVGYFGSMHNSRLLPTLRRTLRWLYQRNERVLLLYVGPDGERLRNTIPDVPIHDAGALPAEEVSRCFSVMDAHLTPILDGVSTRRGSFMTGLQHGIPTVSTYGPHTAPWMREAHGEAFLLAPEDDSDQFARYAHEMMTTPSLRRKIGENGRQFYERHFDWPVVADQLRRSLTHSKRPSAPDPDTSVTAAESASTTVPTS